MWVFLKTHHGHCAASIDNPKRLMVQ
jgi:thiamine pyrophosphokinase